MKQVDIAIVGGGLVGASLALALQQTAMQRNWSIALIEPFAPGSSYQPSYDVRASALTLGSAQIYQQLGIWSQVASKAQPITDIHVSDRGHFAAARLSARQEQVQALGYVVENAWLGHCLWQALDQDCIHWHSPARVEKILPQQQGYQLQLDNGEQLLAGLCVLADGGRSDLRQQLGIHVSQRSYQQTAIISTVSPQLTHNGLAFERFTGLGPMALLPLPQNRCVLIWTRPPQIAEQLLAMNDEQFLQQLQDCFGYRLGRFLRVGSRHPYPLALSQSSEQIRRNLVVLGNAAHSLHPVAGQGYNLSLRDAMSLAAHLQASAQPPGDLGCLQAYLASQQLDQDLIIGFSDRSTRLFSNDQRLLTIGRNLGLLGLDLCPPAKSAFARYAMGLGGSAAVSGSLH